MRTSNKILLFVFAALLLTLTSIYGAIYIKYNNKTFVTAERWREERYDIYPLPAVQSVVLSGLDRVIVIPSDTARLEVEKFENDKSLHVFTNGILIVKGDTVVKQKDGTTAVERNYREVVIYLPYSQNIKSNNCGLTIKAAKDSTKEIAVQLSMEATSLQLGSTEMPYPMGIGNFSSVNITDALGGNINIVNGASIKYMQATLDHANFSDGGAAIDSLQLTLDASSNISLTGRNISRTTFTSKP